ncbi:hypothetical protein JCM19236_4374 [Vibrio sp. JCM 19236]|nr:hypothetical protein JCM19236_4374 [Vibrio sp. JCM 19236]
MVKYVSNNRQVRSPSGRVAHRRPGYANAPKTNKSAAPKSTQD